MSILNWIKKYYLWFVGFIVAIIVFLLAINYEREKISKLKIKSSRYSFEGKIKDLRIETRHLEVAEIELKKKDAHIAATIDGHEKAINEVRDETKNKCAEDVAADFNRMYPSGK